MTDIQNATGLIGFADRAGAPSGLSRNASQAKPLIPCAVEAFLAEHGIAQISILPAMELDGRTYPACYSLVIGNNRYFGATVAEAVAQSQTGWAQRKAA